MLATSNLSLFGQELDKYPSKDLGFVRNMGQLPNTDGGNTFDLVKYYAKNGNDQLYLTLDKTICCQKCILDTTDSLFNIYRVDIQLLNKNNNIEYTEGNQIRLENYYQKIIPVMVDDVPVLSDIKMQEVYNEIDLTLKNTSDGLNLLFSIRPGVSIDLIPLSIGQNVSYELDRGLIIHTPIGNFDLNNLNAWQEFNGNIEYKQVEIHQLGNGIFGFNIIGQYNSNLPINISLKKGPSVLLPGPSPSSQSVKWSTFIEGNRGQVITDLYKTADDYTYVTGYTYSEQFFSTSVNTIIKTYYSTGVDRPEAFIYKFDPIKHFEVATYIGGSDGDLLYSVRTDNNGYVVAVGTSMSDDLPTTLYSGSLNVIPGGLACPDTNSDNGMIVKLTNSLKISPTTLHTYINYFGGLGADEILGLAIDGDNNIYFSGHVGSNSSIPIIPKNNACYVQNVLTSPNNMDGFIAEISPNVHGDDGLIWCTAFGGLTYGGDAEALCGLRLGINNSVIAYGYSSDVGFNASSLYGGLNTTGNIPVVNNGQGGYNALNAGLKDAYIVEFNNEGAIKWSTFFGGSEDENFISHWLFPKNDIAISDNELFIAGVTKSSYANNFPLFNNGVPNALNEKILSGNSDGFIAHFTNNRSLVWSTYVGGNGDDVPTALSIGNTGRLYTTGLTQSTNYQIIAPYGSYYRNTYSGGLNDGFITIYGGSTMSEPRYRSYFGSVDASLNSINQTNPVAITAFKEGSFSEFTMAGTTLSNLLFPFHQFNPNFSVTTDYFYNQDNFGIVENGFISLFSDPGYADAEWRISDYSESNRTGFNARYDNGLLFFETNSTKQINSIELYDLIGRCLTNEISNKNSLEIKLINGCYLIRKLYQDGTSDVSKFIVQQ